MKVILGIFLLAVMSACAENSVPANQNVLSVYPKGRNAQAAGESRATCTVHGGSTSFHLRAQDFEEDWQFQIEESLGIHGGKDWGAYLHSDKSFQKQTTSFNSYTSLAGQSISAQNPIPAGSTLVYNLGYDHPDFGSDVDEDDIEASLLPDELDRLEFEVSMVLNTENCAEAREPSASIAPARIATIGGSYAGFDIDCECEPPGGACRKRPD